MNETFKVFVVLFTLCESVDSVLMRTTCVSKINSLQNNKRNEFRTILSIDLMGFLLCVKMCYQYPDCAAINFNKMVLSCELIGTGATDSELVNAIGWNFMYKTDFQQIYDSTPGNCGSSKRCIKLKSGQVQSSSIELIFTDCFYTPTPGVYKIRISTSSSVKALCHEGGWMVIQHKIKDSALSFAKHWNDYKNGFGKPDGEHWLGNEHVYQYTLEGPTELQVMLNNDPHMYAIYKTFQLSDEANKYRLSASVYSGTAGDSLHHPTANWASDGMKFTTIDSDNDMFPGGNCANEAAHEGWWLNKCSASSLNGKNVWWMLQTRTQSKIMIRRKR